MQRKSIGKQFSIKEIGLIFISGIIFIYGGTLHHRNSRPIIKLSKQETAINVNSTLLKMISMGHQRLITDIIWIQTLMESDTEHYKNSDLNNWMFIRFDTIAILDSLFYENYLFGGQFLNVAKDDLDGALIILRKGLEQFPNDYDLNFQIGFLYYFEMGDKINGLKYLSKIENHPKLPPFFTSVINKLRFETEENMDNVFFAVMAKYLATKDKILKKTLKNDLFSIRVELDLKCLNNKKTNCNKKDPRGQQYQIRNGIFYSNQYFKPYRVRTRKDQSQFKLSR